MANLTTIAAVKTHLGLPADDSSQNAKIAALIEGVSALVETSCRRTFSRAEYTAKIDGDGDQEILLPQFPLLELTGISIDGTAVDIDAEIAAGDITIDEPAGIVFREAGFRRGRQNVVVTFEAGYTLPQEDEESGAAPTLPRDLQLAVNRICARIYERSTAEGVGTVSPDRFQVQYKDSFDPEIQATLDAFTRSLLA